VLTSALPLARGEVVVPDDAIVVRFLPFQRESVLKSAEREHRRIGHYRLSSFADAPSPCKSAQETVDRLLRAAELDGLSREGNEKFLVTSAKELLDRGFGFHK
jgi:hypothetical protein